MLEEILIVLVAIIPGSITGRASGAKVSPALKTYIRVIFYTVLVYIANSMINRGMGR